MFEAPLFSVITVVRNGRRHLGETLSSVRTQQGVAVEHLVADGGSVDGTVALLEQYSDSLAWWTSEPDHGIGHAMNKALTHARGAWLLFVHSDDFLAGPGVLDQAAAHLSGANCDIAAFSMLLEQSDGSRIHISARGFGVMTNLKQGLLHPATLIRRSLFERLGPYDERFSIAMDYEFFLRAYRRRARVRCFPELTLSVMRAGGISSRKDWPTLSHRLAEERLAHRLHEQGCWSALYSLYWPMYLTYSRARNFLTSQRDAKSR